LRHAYALAKSQGGKLSLGESGPRRAFRGHLADRLSAPRHGAHFVDPGVSLEGFPRAALETTTPVSGFVDGRGRARRQVFAARTPKEFAHDRAQQFDPRSSTSPHRARRRRRAHAPATCCRARVSSSSPAPRPGPASALNMICAW